MLLFFLEDQLHMPTVVLDIEYLMVIDSNPCIVSYHSHVDDVIDQHGPDLVDELTCWYIDMVALSKCSTIQMLGSINEVHYLAINSFSCK